MEIVRNGSKHDKCKNLELLEVNVNQYLSKQLVLGSVLQKKVIQFVLNSEPALNFRTV